MQDSHTVVVKTHGCYNRPPLQAGVRVQDGWINTSPHTREAAMITIVDPMTKECQYSLLIHDPQCEGCKHKQPMERSST